MESDTRRMNSLAQLNAQLTDTQRLAQSVGQTFAAGLSQAIVNAFREGGAALRQFASQFLAQVAQMILQLLILRALKSAFGTSLFGGGGVAMAAQGGFFPQYAANGLAGVNSVSSATYFPKFNVVAGEAGREMMTVLARPRFMQIGGMQAVVGNAGGNRLAITNADALARGGGGGANGHVVIEVRHSEAAQAEIVEQSVQGAVVRVTREAQRHTRLREAIKKANA